MNDLHWLTRQSRACEIIITPTDCLFIYVIGVLGRTQIYFSYMYTWPTPLWWEETGHSLKDLNNRLQDADIHQII